MKKEIMQLVNSDSGMLKLNAISRLVRDVNDLFGMHHDNLSIEFLDVNGDARTFQGSYRISSRTFAGIVAECEEYTRIHLQRCTDQLCSNLKNGYIG
jgi:hypothetical protein